MTSGEKMPTLLCVCNYPSNTGYAWDFIESLYAGIARRLQPRDVRVLVAYPRLDGAPKSLEGSVAIPVQLDATLGSWKSILETCRLVRRERVTTIYLTDRPARSAGYLLLRACGVRRVIVHDHASGERSAPAGARRALKWMLARTPGIVADVVIAVSDYVARRNISVGLLPPSRVVRVWNGTRISDATVKAADASALLGLNDSRPVVACACRCAPEKGVSVLLRAFDLLHERWHGPTPRPYLVYMGDGPQLAEIRTLRETLRSKDDILLTGYRPDAAAVLAGATVCVMPSLWQDALPLAVMQPMGLGKPVIASAVGGIPEMIVDGESGLLTPPGDVPSLSAAIERLVRDRALAERLAASARLRVATLFSPEAQLSALAEIAGAAYGAATTTAHKEPVV